MAPPASDAYILPSLSSIEHEGINLEECLHKIFTQSLASAFPQIETPKVLLAPHRQYDYQINNPLALAKMLKQDVKEVMQQIISNVPANSIISSLEIDPKGFIMVMIHDAYLTRAVEYMARKGKYSVGTSRIEAASQRSILIDFSSPNIAKDMHVGHLRSTIIGDCLSRIYEFTGHQVLRVNHVGDWGTQFGMLIAYLKQEYPSFLVEPPDIRDLAAFYKKAKKEFDDVASFKAEAYKEVVALQSGEEDAKKAWTALCEISRREFQTIYDLLNVRLTEVGESFYREWIPVALQEAEKAGLITSLSDGAKVIMPIDTLKLVDADAKSLRRLFLSTFREFSVETELHELIGEELNMKDVIANGGITLAANKVTEISKLDWQTEGEKVYKLCEKKLLSSGSKLHPTLKRLFTDRGFIVVDSTSGEEHIRIPRFEFPLIVVKRDGGYTYDTTDLAAIYYRSHQVRAQHVVYVTDKGQSGHFQLIFAAASDLGWVQAKKTKETVTASRTSAGSYPTVEHVDFGLVTGEDGKRLRTRSGDTVRLRDLIDEAIARCYEITVQREKEHPLGLSDEAMRRNAEVLGIAAIKYFDLRQHRSTDYAFSYEKMCDLSGNTALYLLYAYVRVCGVLRKAKQQQQPDEDVEALPKDSDPVNINLGEHAAARALALHLCRLGGVLDRVMDESMPSRLTEYIYQLTCRFSDLYTASQILGNESNMHLCRVTGDMIRTCLQLLGIDTVEKL